jgi:hypothetical protein
LLLSPLLLLDSPVFIAKRRRLQMIHLSFRF